VAKDKDDSIINLLGEFLSQQGPFSKVERLEKLVILSSGGNPPFTFEELLQLIKKEPLEVLERMAKKSKKKIEESLIKLSEALDDVNSKLDIKINSAKNRRNARKLAKQEEKKAKRTARKDQLNKLFKIN
jgi:hypothetical protein